VPSHSGLAVLPKGILLPRFLGGVEPI
jgi:hypothetical protein